MGAEHCTAIILAAGQGTRMKAEVPKLYLEINEKPILYYTLKTFQESAVMDEVILVVGAGQSTYVQNQLILPSQFTKVSAIVEGGQERYHSVWEGLKNLATRSADLRQEYVFIHDGARALVTESILQDAYQAVCQHQACAVGMPVKDTIKIVDQEGFVKSTPDRAAVWQIQTPQVFEASLIIEAYSKLMQEHDPQVTDDCMVVEQMMERPIKLVAGSYENIKITTPEDLLLAESIMNGRK